MTSLSTSTLHKASTQIRQGLYSLFADNDSKAAITAFRASDSLLGNLLASHLELSPPPETSDKPNNNSTTATYDANPDAFFWFAREGGNLALYESVTSALLEQWKQPPPPPPPSCSQRVHVVDIGVGDGRVVAELWKHLDEERRKQLSLTLVEPVSSMLAECERAVADAQPTCVPRTAQEWLHSSTRVMEGKGEQVKGEKEEVSTLIQASFSLSAIPREERRREVLLALRERADRLCVVEFDVRHRDMSARDNCELRLSAERVHDVVCAYENGVAEYLRHCSSNSEDTDDACFDVEKKQQFSPVTEHGELIVREFLVPCFLGYFSDVRVTTHEQSAEEWVSDLREAGFEKIQVQPLYKYWWSQAVMFVCE